MSRKQRFRVANHRFELLAVEEPCDVIDILANRVARAPVRRRRRLRPDTGDGPRSRQGGDHHQNETQTAKRATNCTTPEHVTEYRHRRRHHHPAVVSGVHRGNNAHD